MSKIFRKYKVKSSRKRKCGIEQVTPKRRHRKHVASTRLRRTVILPYGKQTEKGKNCPAKYNLAKWQRYDPEPGTEKSQRPKAKRSKCVFCGTPRTYYHCGLCKQRYCMRPPTNLTVPGSNPAVTFPSNGPFCYHRDHGMSFWSDFS